MALGPEAPPLESGEQPARGGAAVWGPDVGGGAGACVLPALSLLPSPLRGTEVEALPLAASVPCVYPKGAERTFGGPVPWVVVSEHLLCAGPACGLLGATEGQAGLLGGHRGTCPLCAPCSHFPRGCHSQARLTGPGEVALRAHGKEALC